MKKVFILVLFLLWGAVSEAQILRESDLSEGKGPEFRCRIGQLIAETSDSIRLLVIASVPYDNLHFIRSDSGFSATFELVSSIYDSSGSLVAEQIRNRTVFVQNYRETNLRTLVVIHRDEYRVRPGEYRLRVVLTEKESNGRSHFETTISFKPPDPLLQLSDVFWVKKGSKSQGFEAIRIVRGFNTDETFALARFQTASTGTDSLKLVWQILGSKPEESFAKQERSIPPSLKPLMHEIRLDLSDLGTGIYTFQVRVESDTQHIIRELPFGLSLRGMPRSIVQLDLAIRQVRYIASNTEMRRLRDAPPHRRELFFREFWRRRDPTPGTEENELMEEYYYRVEYTNVHFSTNRSGWEHDRGRIYILYGAPSDIEHHPFEINSKPYEIWYYDQLNRRFVFVDYTGFGDYELVTPEWQR